MHYFSWKIPNRFVIFAKIANNAITEKRNTNHPSSSQKYLCERIKVYLFGSRLDNTKRGGTSICLSVPMKQKKESWLVFA